MSSFYDMAKEQKVLRPYNILKSMEQNARHEMATHLGFRFEPSSIGDPSAEAWEIINCNLKGLQARSHSWYETLNPFAGNSSWLDILQRVADFCEISYSKYTSEADLEYLICEYLALKAFEQLSDEEKKELDEFSMMEPEYIKKIQKAGFGPIMTKLIVKGTFAAAKAGGFGTYITAVKAAAWLNRNLGTTIVMSSVTTGLKAVLRTVNVALWAWLAVDVLDWLFGRSEGTIMPVILQIHMQDKFSQL